MDRRAADHGVPTLELMERAGLALREAALRLLRQRGQATRPRVLILCGKGNNGGDGLALARLLLAEGVSARVELACASDELKGDALSSYRRAVEAGVRVRPLSTDPLAMEGYDLCVDALLGTGLSSAPRGATAQWIARLNDARRANGGRTQVLSVDLPSGLDSDTGQAPGVCVEADETVTFAAPKLGLALFPGRRLAGRVTVADIGVPAPLEQELAAAGRLTTPDDVLSCLPSPDAASHKGSRGRVLVVAGSEGFTGAAALASQSCLRVGAGLVVLGCPVSLNDILEVKVTEVITAPLPEGSGRCLCPDACGPILEELDKAQALVIGPGLSLAPQVGELLECLLPRVKVPTLLDADGLTHLSQRHFALPPDCVLTPHPGEMARLLGTTTQDVTADRVGAAREAARRYGRVVLLKGPDTLVVNPEGALWVNSSGNPGLASAGTGDVLSGTIGGLLGRGLAPLGAAYCGAYLHGLAADLVAEDLGEEGMLASDVASALPRALAVLRRGGTKPLWPAL
jgi:NAD(P)H-hydrate epimerase